MVHLPVKLGVHFFPSGDPLHWTVKDLFPGAKVNAHRLWIGRPPLTRISVKVHVLPETETVPEPNPPVLSKSDVMYVFFTGS